MQPVTEYLNSCAPADKAALEHICNTVKQIAPEAVEGMNYGVPVYQLGKRTLVGFAVRKGGLSLYPFNPPMMAEFADALTGFTLTKGTVQFSAEQPLPQPVLEAIIKRRYADEKQRAS